MGGKIIPRIKLTSVKVVVEVEAELGNKKTCFVLKKIAITKRIGSGHFVPPMVHKVKYIRVKSKKEKKN